ncbi:hypothetical protein BGZ60DRAFT_409451 [Tricladium varicosporioides]|nr:hypothetical protein BGZ60DRAFT_409451 [Hymenoscyphus varicosporioides]
MNLLSNYQPIQLGGRTSQRPVHHGTSVKVSMVDSLNDHPIQPKRMKGKYKTIFGSCTLLTLPLLVLVAILLVLVFYYRVQHNIVGAQVMADEFAITYSRALVSLVAGSPQRVPATVLQQQSEFLVARVLRAPRFLLVAAIMLLTACGFFITAVALVTAQTENIEEVRARFSLEGSVEERTARTINC